MFNCIFDCILILLLSSHKFFAPQIFLPFSLIDDPYSASKFLSIRTEILAGKITGSISNFFFLFPGLGEGRFAFLGWINYLLRYFSFGFNPALHHLSNFILIWVSLTVFYFLFIRMTRNKLASFFVLVLFLLSGLGIENWLRISTLEPIQLLLFVLLISFVLADKSNAMVAAILFFLLTLSKENGLLFSPLIFVISYFLYRKDGDPKRIYSALVMLSISLLEVITWKVFGGNTWSEGNVSILNVMSSIHVYSLILIRLWYIHVLVVFLVLWLLATKRNNYRQVTLFLGISFFSLVVLLPWKFALQRYLFIFPLFFSGFIASTLPDFLKIRSKLKKLFLVVVLLLVLIKWGYINIIERDNFIANYVSWEVNNGIFLRQVSTLPIDSTVIINVNEDNYDANEWIKMISAYMVSFYNRSDIKVLFFDQANEKTGDDLYLANWSVYSNGEITSKDNLIWENQETAYLLRGSIKEQLVSLLRNRSLIRDEKCYWWKLYRISNN